MRFYFFIFLFSFLFGRLNSQNIANFITNGGFEDLYNCNGPAFPISKAKGWLSIDSLSFSGVLNSFCNNRVPYCASAFQYPKTGKSFFLSTFFCPNFCGRGYPKNRLKKNLQNGKIYCVKFNVNIGNASPRCIDGFAVYFGDNTIDTITHCTIPLTYLNPQIKNPQGNIICDTLNWVPISGTFVATGTEKYALLGNFLADNAVATASINTPSFPQNWTDVCIDDVSCIDIDLPAYAGPDQSIKPGDSIFIGRQPDVGIDEACMWFKLPSVITATTPAIDTVAGIWVKSATTTTYVVRQQLWCSGVKWDTVVVYQDFVGLPHVSSSGVENSFKLKMLSNYLLIENANAQNYSLNIYDAQGKQVFAQTNIHHYFEYHFSDNQSGVYFVQIQNQQGVLRKKVVYVKED